MANEDQSTFDVKFALNQFSGNQTLLVKMLDRFCDQYASFTEQLLTSVSTKNYTSAKQEVHSVKGVSGNLGMKALHQSCREFEDVLQQQMISEADSTNLINIMNATLEQVRLYIGGSHDTYAAPEVAPTTPIDADSSARQYLLKALKRNEFITHNKLSSLISDLSMQEDTIQQLQVFINDLDYEKAIALLK
ncbi:MAG: HPt (histidine-containing phosphotransfer) domain-containing protein [Paraglaciecola sp.]